jgi:O-methyltransferase involved in polyketide biosynthesis
MSMSTTSAHTSTNTGNFSSTARWTAAARALKSAHEDRLFDDPLALLLAGEEGAAWAANSSPDSLAPMILRTCYFDDFLQPITQENALRQVVLMAAGPICAPTVCPGKRERAF